MPATDTPSNLEAARSGRLAGDAALYGGCVWLEDTSGARQSVVWPPGYGVRFHDSGFDLLAATGEVVARGGDTVTLGGGVGSDLQTRCDVDAEAEPFVAGTVLAEERSPSSFADTGPPQTTPQPSDPYQLVCAQDQRRSSVYDYELEAAGASTAEIAVQEMLTSEPGVQASRFERLGSVGDDYDRPGDSYTVIGALHDDGTLRAVAYARQSAGGGWLVDTIEFCGTGE